ncbi:MOSC domain-containing protein [Phormidium tenue]|uniref:Sulfurase n=1 Tax=Phormidium tenue NIES-30 TaxID=549789 RepID=A0A1U7J3R2_9CYAN|nr:MOSC domain-containing protein [Phormidium tenue]MBD2233422.1 MOSC domain-containing protein [Phormidium tenue FACHB-1052]OKH46875.1 sulfurase [Phormidium tenue NIES-30]
MTPTGRVVQISVSSGGVPKLPVPAGEVTRDGLEGDRQRNLKFHGGPDRALCLWSLEVIELLRQEGHPIAPGSVGENFTLAGLDWASLAPGSQLCLGDQVWLEITDYAVPCRTIMRWFSDRRFSRISQKHHPGSSRLYARVLQGGLVRTGDRASVQAADE